MVDTFSITFRGGAENVSRSLHYLQRRDTNESIQDDHFEMPLYCLKRAVAHGTTLHLDLITTIEECEYEPHVGNPPVRVCRRRRNKRSSYRKCHVLTLSLPLPQAQWLPSARQPRFKLLWSLRRQLPSKLSSERLSSVWISR